MQHYSWTSGTSWKDLRSLVHPPLPSISALIKLDDIRTKMAAFVMKGIGLGNKPYEQKIPESVNYTMKAWLKFIPQDMDRFIINLYDFVQSFDQEEEKTWFAMSDKWEVSHQFQQFLPTTKSHACRDDPRRAQGFP